MEKQTIITAVLVDEQMTVSLVEVCKQYHISEQMLLEMIDHGLVQQTSMHHQTIHIDTLTLARIQSACRLHDDLGVNIPGAVLALELLDELEQIRDELQILKRHVHG